MAAGTTLMRRTWLCLTAVGLLCGVHALCGAPPAAAGEDEKLLQTARIGVDGPGLLDYFRQRTTTAAQQNHVLALIRQLGDDSFKVRQKATAELAALGPAAVPFLRRSLNDPDQEIAERGGRSDRVGRRAGYAGGAVARPRRG